jgi:hypothetical protein
MSDDFRKSINSILYERTTSPLFGTFFFSWIVWNWKIILVLFFTESSELGMAKFEYIDTCLLSLWVSLINPIISTALILTLYSWLSEKAYMLWLYFNKRKNDHKNKIEKAKLLTVEQSMKLRIEVSNKEETFKNLINDKEELITALKNEITELKTTPKETNSIEKSTPLKESPYEQKDKASIYIEKLKKKNFQEKFLDFSIKTLKDQTWFLEDSTPEHLEYFLLIGLAYISNQMSGESKYDLTEEGKLVFKRLRLELN